MVMEGPLNCQIKVAATKYATISLSLKYDIDHDPTCIHIQT